jgi:5,10-methylenetetrahydrofolate reductase
MTTEATINGRPAEAPMAQAAAARQARASAASNPLRELIAIGRMPVIMELPVGESDLAGYQHLRQRHLASGYELTELSMLGEYLRQLDSSRDQLTEPERKLVRKLQIYADLLSSGKVDLVGIDDGARARHVLDNAVVVALLSGLGVDPARLLPHVVARNRQADQIRSRLATFARLGVRNALLLTGDLPVEPGQTARFPMDSVGMCELARSMQISGELPEDFLIAAAGHPNPDSDPEGLRTLQKALAGARVIITQAIHTVECFKNWMEALACNGALDMVHVIAEVIPISSATQLRAIDKVPGMRVPQTLIARFDSVEQRLKDTAKAAGHPPEWVKQQLRRESVRVTRELFHQVRKVPGVSGVYLGSIGHFEVHLELFKETPLIPEHSEGLHKSRKPSAVERQRFLAQLPAVEALVQQALAEARSPLRQRTQAWADKMAQSPGFVSLLKIVESPKVPLFGCKKCDRCDLSQDALVCPRGCAKQMSHGPCGAPRLQPDGRVLCEDTTRECTWARIGRRRRLFGVPLAEQLEHRSAPSPGFYQGETYSSILPVLQGKKRGPDWRLAWRAPAALVAGAFNSDFHFEREGEPLDLETLAASKINRMRAEIAAKPDIDPEELLVKVLGTIGNAGAIHLIEARLAALGLPAEGTLADLSPREIFQIAEALPRARRRLAEQPPTVKLSSHGEEILAAVGQGRQLRRAVRRELASVLIQHIGSLGVTITYAEDVLNSDQVDEFLSALTIFKDELLLARPQLASASQEVTAYFTRIPYRHHYRSPIAMRRTYEDSRNPTNRVLLIVDLKQSGSPALFRERLREAFSALAEGRAESDAGIVLEPFAGESRSICWQFNDEFWRRIRDFEQATGRSYDASVGGSTDRNLDYVRSTARWHFDKVHEHRLGEERLYVLEIGVASTSRAQCFIEEYRRICELTGHDYHRNTTFLLADFHEEILSAAKEELLRIHPHVEAVRMDAGNPLEALEPFRGKIIYTHLCNVYDNLPTDKIARMDGALYLVEGRLFLRYDELDRIAEKHGLDRRLRDELGDRLSGLSPKDPHAVGSLLDWLRDVKVRQGRAPYDYVNLWMDLFGALREEERYVAITDPRHIPLGGIAGVNDPGALVARQLASPHNTLVHLNQAALSGFADLLQLLHPHGTLEVVDLFVQRLDEYDRGFKGPAKYDGSTVNWLNGPLFRAIAEALGFSVRLTSFRPFDPKSASVIMLASRQAPNDTAED